MSSFNKVILMGNLTRDPEVRFTQGGMAICSIGVAVNERFKDAAGEWQDRATFVDVTIFGKRGEAFAKFHKKGKPCFVEGKLRLDTWEDKQGGGKRSKLYVVGDNWEFVGSGDDRQGGGGGGGGGQQSQGGGWGGGDQSQAGGQQADSWGAPASSGGPAPESFDDTPF